MRTLLAAIAAVFLLTLPARALVSIDVTEGAARALPIAIPTFAAPPQDAALGQQIAQVVEADLVSSGLFRAIDRAAFITPVMGTADIPRFGDWRALGAEAVVTGQIVREGGNRLRVEFRLWDPLQEQQVVGQQFFTTPENWRRVAHIVADAIY
ncbi:MAG: Tol-Pal system protein TolB, partial [Pseudomonadota bacterium]